MPIPKTINTAYRLSITDERAVMDAVASLRTDQASRYLAVLSEHFARHLKVTVKDDTAHIEFPFGRCVMTSTNRSLELVAISGNKSDLGRVEEIVGNHLERYAFRENPRLVWSPAPAAPHQS